MLFWSNCGLEIFFWEGQWAGYYNNPYQEIKPWINTSVFAWEKCADFGFDDKIKLIKICLLHFWCFCDGLKFCTLNKNLAFNN